MECTGGVTSTTGACPAGTSPTGPVLLFLQQAGVGDISVEEAGTQTITQKEPAIFIQDQWQPTPNLTLEYGVRWEELDMPDPITPASDVFFADFIGQTVNTAAGPQVFPSDGNIPDDDSIQPRFALSWAPKKLDNAVLRFNVGYYAARVPSLSIASTRSTNGSRGQTLFRNSELGALGILPPPPAWPNIVPAEEVGIPFFPDVFVFSRDFEVPKTTAAAISWEQELIPNHAFLFKINVANTNHITRFVNRNDALLGSPWSSGLAPAGINGINNLTTVESTAKSRYVGVTVGVNRRASNNLQYQAYYTWSEDESDDDNERDPFTIRYANITNLGPEFGLSDRHQRHRFNGWLLWNAPKEVDVNVRFSYRDNQPLDIRPDGLPVSSFPATERCIPINQCTIGGPVFQRNQGEKDNEFMTLDLRLTRDFQIGKYTLQPVIDIFNLTDEENFLVPETTNLIFNFDGTVRSGAGDAREIQLGLRFVW